VRARGRLLACGGSQTSQYESTLRYEFSLTSDSVSSFCA
jgi:hypothetical protein